MAMLSMNKKLLRTTFLILAGLQLSCTTLYSTFEEGFTEEQAFVLMKVSNFYAKEMHKTQPDLRESIKKNFAETLKKQYTREEYKQYAFLCIPIILKEVFYIILNPAERAELQKTISTFIELFNDNKSELVRILKNAGIDPRSKSEISPAKKHFSNLINALEQPDYWVEVTTSFLIIETTVLAETPDSEDEDENI